MPQPPEDSSPLEPNKLLALTVQDAGQMVEASDPPRGFLPVLTATIATVATFMPLIGYPAGFALLLVAIPLSLWFWLATRTRPKPRILLRTSGSYTGLFLLGILFLQFLNFWGVDIWWHIGLKWAVAFLTLLWLFQRMRRAYHRDRVRDARENII